MGLHGRGKADYTVVKSRMWGSETIIPWTSERWRLQAIKKRAPHRLQCATSMGFRPLTTLTMTEWNACDVVEWKESSIALVTRMGAREMLGWTWANNCFTQTEGLEEQHCKKIWCNRNEDRSKHPRHSRMIFLHGNCNFGLCNVQPRNFFGVFRNLNEKCDFYPLQMRKYR